MVTVKPLNSQTEAARCIRPHYPDVSSLQVVEGQLDVLEVEVEQLGDQVEQAVQNWSLEELSRPYSRLSSLKQELQHQAALRYTQSHTAVRTLTCLSVYLCVLTVHVSPVRGQRLKEVLHLHEFRRESSDLEDWMNQQRQTAESQELGNDYQHVQVTSH